MDVRDLARAISAPLNEQYDAVEVTGVTHNAAWVKPGYAFVAIKGTKRDGHEFIADAVAKGAVAVIGEGVDECPVPYLQVAYDRRALAQASAALHGYPAEALTTVGVTGTDGKTTTSLLTLHLLRSAGLATGLISTIGYQLSDGVLRQPPEHFTTPEAPQVQSILADIRDAGGQAVVLESSSHALALERVGAVLFDVAVWTQLTREHLDFHGDEEGYFAAKRTLIERTNHAVLNADDPWTERLRGIAPTEVRYSAEGRDDVEWSAHDIVEEPLGLTFKLRCPLGEFDVTFPMIGRFNVANALGAMAAAAHCGATAEQLLAGLASFGGVPGRMELIESTPEDPRVIVDFAHTPPSLEKALTTIRATTDKEIWVVLGSAGGPRDPSKRAPLGEVATRLAEHVVFTEEDHRDTPLQEILDEMARGALEAGRTNFDKIGNRVEAIRFAVAQAQPGDTVVLAGKGPEETMERDTETVPWDEPAEAREAIRRRRG